MELSDFLTEWHDQELWVRAHTSGSTGTPKDIRLLKADMRASARATNAFFGIGPKSALGIPLDFDYIAAKMMAVRAEEAGCLLVPMKVTNSLTIDRRLTLLSIVPSQASALISHPEWTDMIDNLLIGGGPLAPSREQELIEAGYRGYCSYGMTETCSHVALRSLGEDLYHAMPGISFETDARGCLCILALAFSFCRLVTNDVVDLVDSHSFRWLGRYDNVLISGGVKIHPEQVEKIYAQYLDCDFYIKGEPDEKWGEALTLVVADQSLDPEYLLAKLKAKIADHKMLPKKIQIVKSLPKAKNGKIRRL